MKSGTLSCRRALLRKNISRFAPFWGIYGLCLVMGLLLMLGRSGLNPYFALRMDGSLRVMALVNCGYALLTVQLLFGDLLYDSRISTGLHTLPLRREQIFLADLEAGLLFSLVPTLIMGLLTLPVMLAIPVAEGWKTSLYWILGANLQYLCFFGMAVACAFCAGSRVSMGMLYIMANLGATLLIVLIDTLYAPMLPGFVTPRDSLQKFSPLMGFAEQKYFVFPELTLIGEAAPAEFTMGPGWPYMWLSALGGAALLAGSLLLYRVRSLERAGDFLAVKSLRPVFLVCFSLVMGMGLQTAVGSIRGHSGRGITVLFGLVGILGGWFVGKMLLERSLRIFTKRTFLGLAGLLAVTAATFLAVWLDPLDLTGWIPQNVESASLSDYYYDYDAWMDRDPELIEEIRSFHALALEEPEPELVPGDEGYFETYVTGNLLYRLPSGWGVRRAYTVRGDSPAGDRLRSFLSRPERVLPEQLREESWLQWADDIVFSGLESFPLPERYRTREDLESLRQAILADCREGTMAQHNAFHREPLKGSGEDSLYALWLDIQNEHMYHGMTVWSDCRHTLEWLDRRELLEPLLGSAAG